MSKTVLRVQELQWLKLAKKYTDPSVVSAWESNTDLKAAWEHFLSILPKNTTRMGPAQSMLEFVRDHSSDIPALIKELKSPTFLQSLIPMMAERAARGERIEMMFARYNNLPPVDEKAIAQQETLTVQRELQKYNENEKVNKIFDSVLTREEQQQFKYKCAHCGRLGTIEDNSRQIRRSDEGSAQLEKCTICKARDR